MKNLSIKILFLCVCFGVFSLKSFGQLIMGNYSVTTEQSKNEVIISPRSRDYTWTSHIVPAAGLHIFPTADGKNLIVLMDSSKSNLGIYADERMVVWNLETGQREAISQKSLISFFPNANSDYAERLNYFNYDNNPKNIKEGNPKLFYDSETHKITGIWSVWQSQGEYKLSDEISGTNISFKGDLKDDKKNSITPGDAVAFDEKNLIAWYPQHILKGGGKFQMRIVKVDYRAKKATIIYQNEYPTYNFYNEVNYVMGRDYLFHRFENVGVKVFSLGDNARPIYEIPEATWVALEKQFGGFQFYNDGDFYFAQYERDYFDVTVVSGSDTSSYKTYKYRTTTFANKKETASEFLIPGPNGGEFIRPIKFPDGTHLLYSKLPRDNSAVAKVGDFDSSAVYDKRLAIITKRESDEKAEADKQARLAEEKRRQEQAEAERKEREYAVNLKQNKPKRYELLRKAIEDNDSESIKLLASTIGLYGFDNAADNYDEHTSQYVVYWRAFSPKLEIGEYENKLSLRIKRPSDFVFVPANRNNSDGKTPVSDEKQTFDVDFFATYQIWFTGKKIDALLTEAETFRNGWSKLVNPINKLCNCRANPSDFQKAFDLTDELTELSSIEVEKIDWHGRVTIRVKTRRGRDWSFSGISKVYESGLLNDTQGSQTSKNSTTATQSSGGSQSNQSSKTITPSKGEAGHFGEAVITVNKAYYPECVTDNCLDFSWATSEQKARMEETGWGNYRPKVGDKGEIIFQGVSISGFKAVVLKIGQNYVPIGEAGIKRL